MRAIRLWPCALAILAAAGSVPVRGEQLSPATVERGRYLVAAGDCQDCHTAEGGKPFAGGRALQTPFGAIFSANITPDRTTGIGAWSRDQFYRALHEGISADGSYLYPAFPYPWYTKITRADADAIWAYLGTLEPVSARRPENDLTWPLDHRTVMSGWNTLFFKPATFVPDPNKSAEWNRGAYLVEGLGHCGTCHTPMNALGASKSIQNLQGGVLQDWYAANLAGDLSSGLGSWSADDIVEFLKTGRNNKTTAYGPMAEVVTYSTSKLNEGDLKAIAVYLKDLPATSEKKPGAPDPKVSKAGEAIYLDNCAACHRSNGEGVPGMFPPLKGDAGAQGREPATVIRIILDGAHPAVTDARPTPISMPSFKWKLSDEEVAAVASYVRSAWGNSAASVSASDVRSLRKALARAEK